MIDDVRGIVNFNRFQIIVFAGDVEKAFIEVTVFIDLGGGAKSHELAEMNF